MVARQECLGTRRNHGDKTTGIEVPQRLQDGQRQDDIAERAAAKNDNLQGREKLLPVTGVSDSWDCPELSIIFPALGLVPRNRALGLAKLRRLCLFL